MGGKAWVLGVLMGFYRGGFLSVFTSVKMAKKPDFRGNPAF